MISDADRVEAMKKSF